MSDRIELYTSALCPYAQRVRLALAEKGLDANEIEIDPRNKPGYFLSLSPGGQVPLLLHNSKILWESAIINEYLDEVFPARPLLPEAPAQRAMTRIWISFADRRIYEPTHRLLLSSDPKRNEELAEVLAAEIRFLEAHAFAMHDGPHVLGEDFGLADVALFPWFEQMSVLERLRGFRFPNDCTRVLEWSDAIRQRASLAAAIRKPDYYLNGYARLAELQRQGRL